MKLKRKIKHRRSDHPVSDFFRGFPLPHGAAAGSSVILGESLRHRRDLSSRRDAADTKKLKVATTLRKYLKWHLHASMPLPSLSLSWIMPFWSREPVEMESLGTLLRQGSRMCLPFFLDNARIVKVLGIFTNSYTITYRYFFYFASSVCARIYLDT